MSGIEIVNGRVCLAYTGEKPWDGLGFEVSDNMTPAQMQVAAGVDWKVKLTTCYTELNKRRIPTGYKALVRVTEPPKCLTVTGNSWHPIQNDDQFNFYKDWCAKGELKMNTAGSLRGGKLVWALAKAAHSFSLFKGKDQIDNYVLFYNPHEYGKSAGIMNTSIRVISNSTFLVPLYSGKRNEFHERITHRQPFNAEKIKATMEQAAKRSQEFKERAEFLASRQLDAKVFKEYCAEVFPTKAKELDRVSRLAQIAEGVLDTQPGHELGAGTWWAAFNAVTFTVDHLMGQRYKSEENDLGMRDRRLAQSWFGNMQRRKIAALDTAMGHATKARQV